MSPTLYVLKLEHPTIVSMPPMVMTTPKVLIVCNFMIFNDTFYCFDVRCNRNNPRPCYECFPLGLVIRYASHSFSYCSERIRSASVNPHQCARFTVINGRT